MLQQPQLNEQPQAFCILHVVFECLCKPYSHHRAEIMQGIQLSGVVTVSVFDGATSSALSLQSHNMQIKDLDSPKLLCYWNFTFYLLFASGQSKSSKQADQGPRLLWGRDHQTHMIQDLLCPSQSDP